MTLGQDVAPITRSRPAVAVNPNVSVHDVNEVLSPVPPLVRAIATGQIRYTDITARALTVAGAVSRTARPSPSAVSYSSPSGMSCQYCPPCG